MMPAAMKPAPMKAAEMKPAAWPRADASATRLLFLDHGDVGSDTQTVELSHVETNGKAGTAPDRRSSVDERVTVDGKPFAVGGQDEARTTSFVEPQHRAVHVHPSCLM